MSGTPNLDRLYAEIIRDRPDRDRDAAVAEFKRRAKLDEECRREMRRILVAAGRREPGDFVTALSVIRHRSPAPSERRGRCPSVTGRAGRRPSSPVWAISGRVHRSKEPYAPRQADRQRHRGRQQGYNMGIAQWIGLAIAVAPAASSGFSSGRA